MSNIDELANLPDITLIDTNAENLLLRAIEAYETEYKKQTGENISVMPGDKERIMLNTMTYMIMLGLVSADIEYKQGSLKYAKGDNLDHIGATRCGVQRPEDEPAIVTMKYIFDGPLTQSQTIPAGNRVSVDDIYFATTESVTANIGDEYVTAVCTCTTAGEIGNGYTAGSITTHTDALAWVKSVINTDTSSGGITITDDDYTRLIYNTPDGYSVAGPVDAYIAKTKEFSSSIIDVFVETPDDEFNFEYEQNNTTETNTVNIVDGTIDIEETNISSYELDLSGCELELNFTQPVSRFKFKLTRGGIVNIYPLLANSVIPSTAFLNSLQEYLSAEKIRPLTDKVYCLAPTEESYQIDFDYYINTNDRNSIETIKTSIQNAVNDYINWQKAKLGEDIEPQELIKRVKQAGAKRLVVRKPVFAAVSQKKIAKCSSVSFNYAGLEA